MPFVIDVTPQSGTPTPSLVFTQLLVGSNHPEGPILTPLTTNLLLKLIPRFFSRHSGLLQLVTEPNY